VPGTPLDLPELARLVGSALDRARRDVLPRFRRVATEWKPDGSPVTEADRAAERTLRAVLEGGSPRFPVVGEEYGGEPAAVHWLVDPIDGTIAFSRGVPLYSTLVALLVEGEAVLGALDLPGLDERYLAWRGGGATCNGQPVRCSAEADLGLALLSRGDRDGFAAVGEEAWYHALDARTPRLRGYTDGFAHAMVLRGAVDAMVDVGVQRHDIAPLEVLVPEAGGRCARIDHPDGRVSVVTGSPILVAWALELRAGPRE
jgi:fructose-1,6-bisphosphatase/inositol monophosphatase family enzyme